jgi:hypothetical protein
MLYNGHDNMLNIAAICPEMPKLAQYGGFGKLPA